VNGNGAGVRKPRPFRQRVFRDGGTEVDGTLIRDGEKETKRVIAHFAGVMKGKMDAMVVEGSRDGWWAEEVSMTFKFASMEDAEEFAMTFPPNVSVDRNHDTHRVTVVFKV
jgi:hypothetical protein